MGVVYKLKQEVVDYIVNQKKDIPQISCRKLADLVSEKFQVTVSKSSINSILKNSQLSSPVGRRGKADKKEKKFEIPSHQKKRLSETLRKVPPPPSPPKSITQKIIVQSEPVPIEQPPKREEIIKWELSDGMGNFLLKAAEWELSNQPLLAELLRGSVDVRFLANLDALSDVLLFLPLFEIQSPEMLSRYCGRGLWVLNGLDEPVSSKEVVQFIQSFQNTKMLFIKMSNERPQLLSEIRGFKFELQDKTEFSIDAQLFTMWPANVHSAVSAPLKKAITTLSEVFINNIHPAIIEGVFGKEAFAASFYQMLAAFENLSGKKISRIFLLGRQGQEIAKFSAVPDKKRFFITGAWPWHQEFEELLRDDPGRPRYFFNEAFGFGIYYNEMEIRLKLPSVETEENAFPLRVIFLRKELKGRPVAALLSNVSAQDLPAENLVGKYLDRWPSLQEGFLEFLDKTKETEDPQDTILLASGPQASGREEASFGSAELWKNIRILLGDLNHYCQRHFFSKEYGRLDFEEMKESFYSLPGQVVEEDHFLKVTLVPENGFKHLKGLEYALRRVNESDIHNNFGKRLIITIGK
jgi:hypothetical protein